MGMYDSFMILCPKCKHELEFQSKTGSCMLANYGKKPKGMKKDYLYYFKTLSPDVAIGLMGDVVRCMFCNSKVELKMNIPASVKVKAVIVKYKKRKFIYDGNYNPKHPDSIKRMKEINKILKGNL